MYSVIIVDDELFVRKGLIQLIDWASHGFQVSGESDNGEDALAMIQETRPDLVITDIRMPVLDGLALIEAAAQLELETEFIIISGYNDFRYAQQALRFGVQDYVLKPVDPADIYKALTRLKEKLSSKKQRFDQSRIHTGERLMEALLRDKFHESELQNWDETGVFSQSKAFTYVLLEVNNIVPWKDTLAPTRDQLKAAIREVVQRVAVASSPPIIYEHRRAYGFIVLDEWLSSFEGNIRPFMEIVLQRMKEMIPLELRIYAGRAVESLQQLKFSYISAKEVNQYKWVKHENSVIVYSDVEHIQLSFLHLQEQFIHKLTEAVEETNLEGAKAAINHIFSDFLNRCYSIEAIKTAIMQCVLSIINSVRRMEGDEKELATIESILGWHDYNLTLNELRQLFHNFVLEAAELTKNLYYCCSRGGIHKIKTYVDQNFHSNLSLKSLAAQFFMNPAYIGQLFKKSYGVYFNDYVLGLRVEEAKKLIRQTDMRIYEIAQRVGFNSTDYFVSQFEKVEGMIPSEYRNQLGNR